MRSVVVAGSTGTGLGQVAPSTHPDRDAAHFGRMVAARRAVTEADAELRDAVAAAREAGDSWTIIGMALETPRQGARRKYGWFVMSAELADQLRTELDEVRATLNALDTERQMVMARAAGLVRASRGVIGMSEVARRLQLSRPTVYALARQDEA